MALRVGLVPGLLGAGSEAGGAAAGFHGKSEFDCHFVWVIVPMYVCMYVGGGLSDEIENSRVWIPV